MPVTTVLAIHAHPDDIEFLCAGTLALLRGRGCRIVMVTMTPGDCGSAVLPAEEISAVRREEARASARLLDAEYLCAEFGDFSIVLDNPSRHRVTEIVRRVRPDLAITASPADYLSDHEITSQLVRDACFFAPAPNYATEQPDPAPPIPRIPYLYYTDPIEGKDMLGRPVEPEFCVDVSAVLETKRRMLMCHQSQRDWLLKQHGIDEYIRAMEEWSAQRGRLSGVPYAEGFRQHRGHAYPQENMLLETLRRKGAEDPTAKTPRTPRVK